MARRQSEVESDSQPPPPGVVLNPVPAHWERTCRLTGVLLAIWFCVTFSVIFFARELSQVSLFGWPISYYMAAQGATLVYVILVGYYAWRMWRLDRAWFRENATVRSRGKNDAA